MENAPGRVGAICWEFRIASLVPRSGIVHIDSVETIPISKSATVLKLYRLLPRTPIHMSCTQSIALSGSGFFYCRLGDCLWVRLEAKNNVEQYQGVNRSVRRRCFRVRSARPPPTSRFSLPSFVIRGFLSSEHGGRRAKPLFSIVWYSLQTVQALIVMQLVYALLRTF